jgi:hypothetical protein
MAPARYLAHPGLGEGDTMPTLPLIDLLILMGWTSLFVGATQKAIWITTSYRPTILTLTPIDFLWVAGVCLLFALSLAARTWVKLHEGKALVLARSRRRAPVGVPARDDGEPGVPLDRALPLRD